MVLVFDMDGTLADFYNVTGWLDDLRNERTRPYVEARPLYPKEELNTLLIALKAKGWKIVITSWLAKNSTPAFDNAVRKAKKEWLDEMNFPYDEIHLVKYGTTKADCTRKQGGFQILIDDNEKVRNGWHLGATIDANQNILPLLAELL